MDPLPDDARRLAARLALLVGDPGWAPWPAPLVLARVDSTMTVVRERAGEGAPEGTTVVADEQTAGRGRHGRAWQSPPGSGVWTSVLLRPPDMPPVTWGVLPLLIGDQIAGALERLTGAPVRVKWPNDIVIVDSGTDPGVDPGVDPGAGTSGEDSHHQVIAPPRIGKLAGILAERLPDGAVVVGVGVNVRTAPPDSGARALVDIADGTHREGLARDEVAAEVLVAIARAASLWARGEHDLGDYRSRCITLGRRVSVTAVEGADAWQGRALDVDDAGLLLVEDSRGTQTAVSAGDVTLA